LKSSEPRPEHYASFTGQNFRLDFHTSSPQPGGTSLLAGGWIDQRDDHTFDSGVDEGLPAGGRASLMVTRLESDDRGGSSRERSGGSQRVCFRVRLAFTFVVALAYYEAVRIKQHAADRWVGAGRADSGG